MRIEYADYQIYNIDGLKIEFEKEWVHIRKSNTEPIIRIYSESQTRESADKLSEKIIRYIEKKIEDL